MKRLYGAQSDPCLGFDKIYLARSTPLHQVMNKRRVLELKQKLMGDDQKFINGLKAEIEEVGKLKAAKGGAVEPPPAGETLFIEEYAPFGVGEICGDV